MTYNITAVGNTTGVLDFIQKIDKYIFCYGEGCGVGGLLGTTILIIIFGVLMFNFISNGKDFNSSLMAASFICTIMAVMLFLMDLIIPTAIYVSAVVWGISAAIGNRR